MTICRYGDPTCPCQRDFVCRHAGKNPYFPQVQEVVLDFPPIYDQLKAAFPDLQRRRDVIFSFGERIYNPHGVRVTPELLAHEAEHGHRQRKQGLTDWWRRYLEDPYFRFVEEVHAHQAELRWLNAYAPRGQRRRALSQVTAKLASPLYGHFVPVRRVRAILQGSTMDQLG